MLGLLCRGTQRHQSFYQETALIRNRNKPKPSKPLLHQLKQKAQHVKDLVPQVFRSIFMDESLHLVFVDTENNYCITRNLGNIAKYWFEGADSHFNVPRHYHLKATTGRKSELDVCFLYNYLFHAVKKCLL